MFITTLNILMNFLIFKYSFDLCHYIIKQAFFCVVFGVLFYVFFENFSELFNSSLINNNPITLVVGILSARENFLQRSVARSTWLKSYLSRNSDYIKYWFILGNSSCSIPPDYRHSYYNCEKWDINTTDLKKAFFTLKTLEFGNLFSQKTVSVHQGFTFKVNHPLIITKLGILSHAIASNKVSKVAILDIHSKEVIVEASILNNASESHHGYSYVPVDNILLPKNYEGLVLFEGYLQHSLSASLTWDDGGGVITFKRIYPTPYHHDSIKYSADVYSVVSIGFIINEMENLIKLANEDITARGKWHLHLKNVEEKIMLENNQYKDLLIVDSVDIYRSLPSKVLHFYKWLHSTHNFLFVMKTDDDTVINIEALLKKLQHNSKFDSTKLWLWSRFRKNWPVNYIGKWADDDYKSDHYPTFPCGAAYITSHQTASWLSNNSDSLFPYQGEDVSMGIWLSAINPDYIEDEHFECGSSCNTNSYNRAQLKPEEIQKVWSTFETCKNLCKCNNS